MKTSVLLVYAFLFLLFIGCSGDSEEEVFISPQLEKLEGTWNRMDYGINTGCDTYSEIGQVDFTLESDSGFFLQGEMEILIDSDGSYVETIKYDNLEEPTIENGTFRFLEEGNGVYKFEKKPERRVADIYYFLFEGNSARVLKEECVIYDDFRFRDISIWKKQ